MKGTRRLSVRCSESYKWWLKIHTNHPSRDSTPSGSPGEALLTAPAWWSRPRGDAPAPAWEGVQSVCGGTSVISQATLTHWFQLMLLVSFLLSFPPFLFLQELYLCLLNPSFYSGLHFILRLLFSNLNLAIRGNGPESSLGQMIRTLKSRTRAQTPFPGVYLSSFSTLSCCRLDLYFGREVGYGSWDGDVVQPPPWEGRTPVTILLEGDMGQAPPAAGGHFGRWVV